MASDYEHARALLDEHDLAHVLDTTPSARCAMCGDLGWILDCNDLDKPGPRQAEMLPCLTPDCEASGQPIQTLSFAGPRFDHASAHPRTGVLMSVSVASHREDRP